MCTKRSTVVPSGELYNIAIESPHFEQDIHIHKVHLVYCNEVAKSVGTTNSTPSDEI